MTNLEHSKVHQVRLVSTMSVLAMLGLLTTIPPMVQAEPYIHIDRCAYVNEALGTLLNIVNGLRLECMATRNRELMFYTPSECDTDRNFHCQPMYITGDSFFDSFSYDYTSCRKPGEFPPSDCWMRFKKDVQVNFYPNNKDLMAGVLRSTMEINDGAQFDTGYLFNLLDNPEFLDHMAYVLGISATNLWGDYGYVVVKIDKKGIAYTYEADISQSTINQQRKTNFINDLTAAVTDDEIVKLMSKYGTHYLARYDSGDYLLQTFVFNKADYASLQTQWEQDSGNTDGNNFLKYVGTSFTQTYVAPVELGRLKTYADDPLARGEDTSYWCRDKLVDSANGFDKNHRSIFKFVENQDKMETYCATMFDKRAPIKLQFGSLTSLLLGSQDQALKDKWESVMAKALTNRFGLSVNINTPNFVGPPPDTGNFPFYGSFNPAVVTHTASAYTSIIQMHYDLSDLNTDISNPQFVEHIVIMADVIEIGASTTEVTIPGSVTVHIICRQLISHSTSTVIPTLFIDTDDVNISAEELIGVLKVIIRSSNSTRTYYNTQLIYSTVDDTVVVPTNANPHTIETINSLALATSNEMPRLYTNDPNDKLSTFLHKSFVSGHELALTTTEVILQLGVRVTTNSESIPRAVKVLDWISGTLSQLEATELGQSSALSFDQDEILTRVLLIKTTRVPFYLNNHVLVPTLTYVFYKPYYDDVLNLVNSYETEIQNVENAIEQRLLIEKVVQNQQQMDDNIIEVGKFLVQQATANQQKEVDIKNSFDQLITINEDSITSKQTYADQVIAEITTLQSDAKRIGDTLVACIKKETIISIIFSVIEIAATLFPTPGSKTPEKVVGALTKMQKLLEKIQKVVKIVNTIKEIYGSLKNIKDTLSTMTRALEGLEAVQGGLDEFPTKLDWDDYDIEVAQYTTSATVPSACTGDAADFKAASNKISARGRVYLDTVKDIEKLQLEVVTQTLEQDVADKHAQRLETLSTSLNQASVPRDVIDTSNLYDIGFFLKMRLNEVRIDLAQIYINMDAALQYHLLQGPSIFSDYTTRAIYQASVNQIAKAEQALKNLKPSEFSVPFVFDIPNVLVDDLFSLSGVSYTIPIDYATLLAYQRVRVLEVRTYIDNIVSSTYNRVQVDALARGEFKDRDSQSNTRYFVTEPVSYPFVYEISTQTIILTNRPLPSFEDTYMQMTPFTDWVIRINPDNANNLGLQFNGNLANIRLELYMSASVIGSSSG